MIFQALDGHDSLRVATGGARTTENWVAMYRRSPEKWRDEIKWNVCMHTKGSPLAAPELYECYLTVQKTESPQAAPREMMRWSQMEQKDRHCRCPNNRKLSGHRRCSEKWRNEMKWEEKNGYSMTEQKTESPQAEPKEMMRWTQTKYVTGSPLVKPFAAQKVFRCLSKY